MRIGIFVNSGTAGAGDAFDGYINEYIRAEEEGFDTAWTPNIFGHDGITMLALAGRVTKKIELGTFVVPTYSRHPLAMAQQALTANAAASGRLTLGIGLSHQVVIEGMMGLDFSKPVRHMREYLSVLMPLLEGAPVSFAGEEFRVNAQVQAGGAEGRPSVVVAALGPQMLKVAGRLADGTATWMGGAKYLEDVAIPAIRASAKDAGRAEPRIVAGFPVALTTKPDEARAAARQALAVYPTLPSYKAALDAGGAKDAGDVLITGTEEELEREFRRLRDIGVTDLNFASQPFAADPDSAKRTREFMAGLAKGGL